jgi:hypothetical protein
VGAAFYRGVIVTALPESLIIDIMEISSFDVPVGHVGHFTTARTFFGRSLWNPHLLSDLREGVTLKMDQRATHVLAPVTRRGRARDLSRINPSRIRGDALLIVIRVAIRDGMYARNTISTCMEVSASFCRI